MADRNTFADGLPDAARYTGMQCLYTGLQPEQMLKKNLLYTAPKNHDKTVIHTSCGKACFLVGKPAIGILKQWTFG